MRLFIYRPLVITLSDQKAILFYMGFLPAFIELSTLTTLDVLLLVLIAITSVGSVKIAYAYLANKATFLLQNTRIKTAINRTAGTAMLATGLYLIITCFHSVH